MAITFLFFKIIEKFQVLVKGIDWGKKKYFCHFRVSQIFFCQKIKIKVKSAKIAYEDHTGGGSIFLWPIVFPDQFTIDNKKKIWLFDFLGFFYNLVHPIFHNFKKNQVFTEKEAF